MLRCHWPEVTHVRSSHHSRCSRRRVRAQRVSLARCEGACPVRRPSRRAAPAPPPFLLPLLALKEGARPGCNWPG